MGVPAFLIMTALVLVLPIALALGGHNGATLVGVIVVVVAIVATIATTPKRGVK